MKGFKLAMYDETTYYVETPKKWAWQGLPSKLDQLRLFPTGSSSTVDTVLCLAFGPIPHGYSDEDNYFIIWKDTQSTLYWKWQLPNYHDLSVWLGTLSSTPEILASTEVSLGHAFPDVDAYVQCPPVEPNTTSGRTHMFVARSGSNYRWDTPYTRLNDLLRDYARNRNTICHVAFSLHGWVLYDDNGGAHWQLPDFHELNGTFRKWEKDKSKYGAIQYVSLDITHGYYLIMFAKGKVQWILPTNWSKKIEEFIECYRSELVSDNHLVLSGSSNGGTLKPEKKWGFLPRIGKTELMKLLVGTGGISGFAASAVTIAVGLAPMCTIL